MECTQRLECTQELYETHTERVCPEQIGFLGICGTKHPILRGPNKIGRDPQTCSIVLNLNSVSRQHAVINVLNSKEFMVMDLDSSNKTKLLNKTLQPYIPHPISNGDTVQFGDIFGIFRLLEEDNELPMTQAIDIPETPVQSRYISKLNKAPTTIIPESPDVSDRDESFTTPSDTKAETTRLSSSQFIKPFGKTIQIRPIISPKTDTTPVSSKISNSLTKTNLSLNKSVISPPKPNQNVNNIHEMDTQVPYPVSNPCTHESTESIYMADTQIPPGHLPSPSIHSLDTQIPQDHLPQIRKIDHQQDMQFDIYAANKENDLSIFNAETQPFICEKHEPVDNKGLVSKKISDVSPEKENDLNKSEEELLFEEIDDECLDDFNSQPLLPQESPKPETKSPKKERTSVDSDVSTDCEEIDMLPTQKVEELPLKISTEKTKEFTASKRNRINSDSSTDCDDIEFMATQKIPEFPITNDVTKNNDKQKVASVAAKRTNRIQSEDSTDCEDIALTATQKIPEKKTNDDEDVTDCEDDLIEISAKDRKGPSMEIEVTKFEDMPTQVLEINQPAFEDMDTQIIGEIPAKSANDDNFEDQPTQIVDEIIPSNVEASKKSFKDIVSPFKIPLQSPIRVKSKEIPKAIFKEKNPETITVDDDDNYYNATQDILDDLCTQRDGSPILEITSAKAGRKSPIIIDDDIVPCSVEDYKVGEKFANIDRDLSPTKSSGEQRAKKFAANLSSQEVRDVIGVDVPVDNLKKFPSGDSQSSSDVECTPKKVRSFLFTDSDLPNSQEIKSNIFVNHAKTYVTDSSSESEQEAMENTEDQNTPFVHRRRKKPKTVAKIDLTKKFDAQKLPERIITRVRKPTAKMEEALKNDKKANTNILKPKFLTEQEDQINEDIIKENVKRLKDYGKAKSSKDKTSNNTDTKPEEDKNVSKSKDNKNKTDIKPEEDKNVSESKDNKNKTDIKPEEDKNVSNSKDNKNKTDTKPEEDKNVSKSKDNKNKTDTKPEEDKNVSKSKDNKNETKSLEINAETKAKEIKNDMNITAETKSKEVKNNTKRNKTDNKSNESKEKIKVKIERPRRKDDKDTKHKEKEGPSRKSTEERSTRRSKEKSPVTKNTNNKKSENDKNISKDDLHTSSDAKTTRSTRSRRKATDNKKPENKSVSPDNKKEVIENKPRRPNRKREPPKDSMSPEVEIRRSRRQANAKDKQTDSQDSQTMEAPKSILKKSIHEQSTVYNVSSSSTESPKNLKRSLADDSEVPSPKRTRAFVNSVHNTSNVSLRATPARTLKTQHVLFTAFPSEEVKQKLEKLGAVIVTDVMQCSIVLTMQVKRTFKLLCAVGLGRPIVGPSWVQACVDTHMIVDPWLYIVKDEPAEKRFQFNLEKTLNGKRNFLKGYNVSSTPSVQPNASEMKLIVECSGGTWKEGGTNWVCVSSTKDQALWPALRKRGATVVSTEFILGGVLRQKLEINANKFP